MGQMIVFFIATFQYCLMIIHFLMLLNFAYIIIYCIQLWELFLYKIHPQFLNSMLKIIIFVILSILSTSIDDPSALKHQNRLLLTSNYVTNSNRSQIVEDFCQFNSRNNLYNQYGINKQIPYTGQVSNYFNLNTSIVDYILDQNWDQVKKQVHNNISQIVFYYGPWMLGLLIALLIWPFLFCCCACPLRFPCCCKKQMQELPYTQVELKWPAVFTLILLVCVMTIGTISLISSFKSNINFNDIACSSGIFMDDLINGNVSFVNQKNFFVGFSTFDSQLRLVNSSIISLYDSISKINSTSPNYTTYNNQILVAKNDTFVVPNLTGGFLQLNYHIPIQSLTTNSTIQSEFPNVLGTSNSTSKTLVSSAFYSLTILDDQIWQIKADSDNFTNSVSNFTTYIDTALSLTSFTSNQIKQKQIQTNDFFITNRSYGDKITIGQYVFYGCIVFFGLLELIAIVSLVWFKKFSCRLLLYTTCTFLFLLCLVAFGACISASILNPVSYYFCQYVDEAIANRTRLLQVMNKRFNTDGNVIGNVSQCIATDGTKIFAQSLIGQEVYSTLVYLNNTFMDLTNFNSSNILKQVSTNFSTLISQTQAYRTAEVLDIKDQNSINELIKLSKAIQYSCSSAGFNEDSWVPSNNQQTVYVNCRINGGFRSNANTCQNNINFENRANGCVGCMDTYSIFESNATSVDVRASLDARYPTPNCAIFNQQMSNVWQNFYKPKNNIISPVQNRAIQANSSASILSQTVQGSVSPLFQQVKKQIQLTSDSVVHKTYGTLAGLNCGIINEDVLLFKQVFCQNAFVYTYYLRVIFAILSFFLLFISCCSVCVGQRQFKQKIYRLQKQKKERQRVNENMEGNLQTAQRFVVGQQNNQNAIDYNQIYNYNQPNPYKVSYNN